MKCDIQHEYRILIQGILDQLKKYAGHLDSGFALPFDKPTLTYSIKATPNTIPAVIANDRESKIFGFFTLWDWDLFHVIAILKESKSKKWLIFFGLVSKAQSLEIKIAFSIVQMPGHYGKILQWLNIKKYMAYKEEEATHYFWCNTL